MTHDEIRQMEEATRRAINEVYCLKGKLEDAKRSKLAKRADTIIGKLIALEWDICKEKVKQKLLDESTYLN